MKLTLDLTPEQVAILRTVRHNTLTPRMRWTHFGKSVYLPEHYFTLSHGSVDELHLIIKQLVETAKQVYIGDYVI